MTTDMSKELVQGLKTGSDMRRAQRNACFLRGHAHLNAGENMPCEIHDIANNSARIVLNEAADVPDRFILSIPRRHVKEWVRVVRRSEKDFGVIFEDFHF